MGYGVGYFMKMCN